MRVMLDLQYHGATLGISEFVLQQMPQRATGGNRFLVILPRAFVRHGGMAPR